MELLSTIGLTMGIAFVSAFVPVVTIEIYLIQLVERYPDLGWWWLAAAATIGQVAGKLVFYAAGRELFALPRWLHRKAHKQRQGWFRRWLQRFHDAAEHRPLLSAVVLFVSAVVGIPPYGALAFLAGLAEIKLWVFLSTGLVGRGIRFAVVVAVPSLIEFWIL